MMYATIKRWVKTRFGKDSLVWKLLSVAALPLNLPKTLYRRVRRDSTFYFESEMDMCSLFPKALLDRVVDLYRPASVLDLGCGTGRSLAYFLARGVDAHGVENSALAIEKSAHPDRITRANLNQPVDLGRTFDLVWSYEVVEHIHPRYVETLVDTFSRHGDTVVLSAARPGQGGQGHFNEQPPSYWIDRFRHAGFRLDGEATAALRAEDEEFAGNMLAFVRDSPG